LFDSFNGTEPAKPDDENQNNKKYRCSMTETSPNKELWTKLKPWLQSLSSIRISNGTFIRTLPFQSSWVWAMNATEQLWNDLQSEGYTHLPTRRLNQDALENLFSIVRTNAGNARSVTAEAFEYALTSALFNILNSRRGFGNCEEDESSFMADLSTLLSSSPSGEINDQENEEAGLEDEDLPASTSPVEEPALDSHENERAEICAEHVVDGVQALGFAQIAGAAVKKLLPKIGNCRTCSSALTTSLTVPAHATIDFKNQDQNLIYASQDMLSLTGIIMKIGHKLLPKFLHQAKVLHSFQSLSSRSINFDLLPFCPGHKEFAKTFLLNYLCKTSLYKVITETNDKLRQRDTLSKMVESRTRRGRYTPLADFFSKFDDVDDCNTSETLSSSGYNESCDSFVNLEEPEQPASQSGIREYFMGFDDFE